MELVLVRVFLCPRTLFELGLFESSQNVSRGGLRCRGEVEPGASSEKRRNEKNVHQNPSAPFVVGLFPRIVGRELVIMVRAFGHECHVVHALIVGGIV